MNKYYFILSRLLYYNHFSLKYITNLSILISTALCICIIPITLSITSGFKNNIIEKITLFDGYARLYVKDLGLGDKVKIDNILSDQINPFYENECIIKTNNDVEGVTWLSAYNISNVENMFITHADSNTEGVYIGSLLDKKLFNKNSQFKKAFIIDNKNLVERVNIKGVFETGIPLYDQHMVISKISDNQDIKDYDGYLLDETMYLELKDNLALDIYNYEDRYYTFIKWLDSYDIPINILLLFIVLIGLINNHFCYKIDLVIRKKDFSIYYLLGLSKYQINLIYYYKYVILILAGIIIGSSVSYLILKIELNYNLVQLPTEIYFTSNVPIALNFINFFYLPVIFLLHSIYFFFHKYEN
jgi:putative ABC transport system permease protein